MAVPTKTQLGGATTNKKWWMDADSTPAGPTSTWVPVQGIVNFVPLTDDGGFEDDSDYDGNGNKSQAKTMTGFSATCTVGRKVLPTNSTQYDPGQELLRAAFEGTTGVQANAHIRFYEMEPGGPRIQAYAGIVSGSWAEQGGTVSGLSQAEITMNGRGALTKIAHPDTAAAVVPIVGSLSPAAAGTAGGTLVEIFGTGFTGATAVTVGGTAVTSFKVISDSIIVAVTPAKSAGTYPVAVTNTTGVSTVTANIVVS